MSRLYYDGSFEEDLDTHFYRIVPLDSRILVVASVNRAVGDWTAYIGAIPFGDLHRNAWTGVKEWGTKLAKHIAAAIFPELNRQFSWRN